MTAKPSTFDRGELFRAATQWTAPQDLDPADSSFAAGVTSFLYREAALLEDDELDAWLDLFTDDATYWVPVVYRADDPRRTINLIYDSRELLDDRVARLKTGEVPSQDPPSRTVRTLSNVTVAKADADGGGGELLARAAFVLVEHRPRAQRMYAGRCTYRLRREASGLRIAGKKVELLNSDDPLPSMTFLL